MNKWHFWIYFEYPYFMKKRVMKVSRFFKGSELELQHHIGNILTTEFSGLIADEISYKNIK